MIGGLGLEIGGIEIGLVRVALGIEAQDKRLSTKPTAPFPYFGIVEALTIAGFIKFE